MKTISMTARVRGQQLSLQSLPLLSEDTEGVTLQVCFSSRWEAFPEKYATLQVRVCGWNEYFVKLSKVKQDMFIKQCEVSG